MIANYHTHTRRCNHATGTEEEYVQAALAAGLKTLGFADHAPYIFPDGYYAGFRMRPEELTDYCATVRALRKKYQSRLEILLGLETEYYPDYFPGTLSFLQDHGVEYMILGQHFVGNEMGETYNGKPTGDVSVLEKYVRQSQEAMQTGLFTYFAHPDLINYVGDADIYSSRMRHICREAKSCGIPLEINLLGLREGRNYPNSAFWEMAAEEGNSVIIGCDAHAADHFLHAESYRQARELVDRLGLQLLETVPIRSI